MHNTRNQIEAILFVADEPISVKKLAALFDADESEITSSLKELQEELRQGERGIQIREVAGGYKLYTHPAYAEAVERYLSSPGSRRLSQAALEVLAIIAYRQPTTRALVTDVRGVNSDSVISSLTDKGLIDEAGHEDCPGSPTLYRTSALFLEKFGLGSLSDLPTLDDFAVDDETAATIRSRLSVSEPGEDNPFRALVD